MTALTTYAAAAAAVNGVLRVLPIAPVPAARLPAGMQRSLPHAGSAVLVDAAVFGAPAGATPASLVGAWLTGLGAWRFRGVMLPTVTGVITVAVLGAVW